MGVKGMELPARPGHMLLACVILLLRHYGPYDYNHHLATRWQQATTKTYVGEVHELKNGRGLPTSSRIACMQ